MILPYNRLLYKRFLLYIQLELLLKLWRHQQIIGNGNVVMRGQAAAPEPLSSRASLSPFRTVTSSPMVASSSSSAEAAAASAAAAALVPPPLLPFSVTPPKPTGPSEAEKKIEELTKAIEEQMEKDEEQEYFGKSIIHVSNKVEREPVVQGVRSARGLGWVHFNFECSTVCPILPGRVDGNLAEAAGQDGGTPK